MHPQADALRQGETGENMGIEKVAPPCWLGKKRPETRDQRPETRDQRPEIRDQRSERRQFGAARKTAFASAELVLLFLVGVASVA